MKMGGFSPEEIKEQLKSVAHEYSIGDWALEYIAQLEAENKKLREERDILLKGIGIEDPSKIAEIHEAGENEPA